MCISYFFDYVLEPSLLGVPGRSEGSYRGHVINRALGVGHESDPLKPELHRQNFLPASQVSGMSVYAFMLSCQ